MARLTDARKGARRSAIDAGGARSRGHCLLGASYAGLDDRKKCRRVGKRVLHLYEVWWSRIRAPRGPSHSARAALSRLRAGACRGDVGPERAARKPAPATSLPQLGRERGENDAVNGAARTRARRHSDYHRRRHRQPVPHARSDPAFRGGDTLPHCAAGQSAHAAKSAAASTPRHCRSAHTVPRIDPQDRNGGENAAGSGAFSPREDRNTATDSDAR